MLPTEESTEVTLPPTSIRRCPLATPVTLPSTTVTRRPRFYYILIDNSISYQDEQEEVISIIKNLLPNILEPGDEISIALIGRESADLLHSDGFENVPLPLVPPLPVMAETPSASLTLIPLPETPPDNMTLLRVQVTQTNAAIIALNEQTEAEATRNADAIVEANNCNIFSWNEEVTLQIISNQEQQAILQQQLISNVSNSLATLSSLEPDDETNIYGAFYTASQDLGFAKLKEKEPILLIFFFFLDSTAANNEYCTEQIDLSGVTVIAAAIPFDTSEDDQEDTVDSYVNRITYWDVWFAQKSILGQPHFFTINQNNIDAIVTTLQEIE
ncbi:MAG: hypothetical protein KDE34_03250 [Anaerolineales bacterium]|nr:hypothetical protein [Anaerolineales bacterium]